MENILLKKCSKCKIEKILVLFSKDKFRKDGLRNWCKECVKIQNKTINGKKIKSKSDRKYLKTIKGRLNHLLENSKLRAKKKKLEFNINIEWLLNQWIVQNGCCLLSGIVFDLESPKNNWKSNPYAPSIDRIDSKKGYTKDNCRLITTYLNIAINEYGFQFYIDMAEHMLKNLK